MTTKRNGFTLAEVLIVVTILVLIGLTILVGLNPMAQLFKGYDARRKSDLSKIKIAMEAYYADHDCYPDFPLQDAELRPSYACGSDILKPYLDSMPCDPTTKKPYTIYVTPEGSTCPQQFAFYAQMYSFFDDQANSIASCPKTVAFTSTGMLNSDIIYGCSFKKACSTLYGCKNGACVLIAEDGEEPSCGPTFCDDPLCNPTNEQDCQTTDSSGEYVRECVDF